jgi:anti-anti-sigma regulatory factor
MADCEMETNERALILHLSGEVMIAYADQLRSILIDSLEKADRIEIDTESVTGVDISCLQLFCAFHRTSVHMNKSVAFLNVPSGFRQAIRQAGFTGSGGCGDKGAGCLWSEERDYE